MSKIEKTDKENAESLSKTLEKASPKSKNVLLAEQARAERIRNGTATNRQDGLIAEIKKFFKPYDLSFIEDLAFIASGHIAKMAEKQKIFLDNKNIVKLIKGQKTDFVATEAITIDGKPYPKMAQLQIQNYKPISNENFDSLIDLVDEIKINPEHPLMLNVWTERKEIQSNKLFKEVLSDEQMQYLKKNHYLDEPVSMQMPKDTKMHEYKVSIDPKNNDISAVKLSSLVGKITENLLSKKLEGVGEQINEYDKPEVVQTKNEKNVALVANLIVGKPIHFTKSDENKTLYFDPHNNILKEENTNIYKQLHFKSFVTDHAILADNIRLNPNTQSLELAYQLFNKDNQPTERGMSIFEIKHNKQVTLSDAYEAIKSSPRGKGIGIDKISIQDARESKVELTMRVVGNALVNKNMHKDRFVMDYVNMENNFPRIQKKSIYEANSSLKLAQKQIQQTLHFSQTENVLIERLLISRINEKEIGADGRFDNELKVVEEQAKEDLAIFKGQELQATLQPSEKILSQTLPKSIKNTIQFSENEEKTKVILTVNSEAGKVTNQFVLNKDENGQLLMNKEVGLLIKSKNKEGLLEKMVEKGINVQPIYAFEEKLKQEKREKQVEQKPENKSNKPSATPQVG